MRIFNQNPEFWDGYVQISFVLAWYDFWVGFYWDKENKRLYFLPIPCVGLLFEFNPQEEQL